MSKIKTRVISFSALGLVILAGFAWFTLMPSEKMLAEPKQNGPIQLVALRRLSPDQYRNSISDIFGEMIEIKTRFVVSTPRAEGLLEIGGGEVSVSPVEMEVAEAMAREIAEQVVSPAYRDELLHCQPKNPKAFDPDCALHFLVNTGRLVYRRSLTEEEISRFLLLAEATVSKSMDFYGGIERVLANMLVSPNFLFRVESALPGGNGGHVLDGLSRASRLSFMLWNSTPDIGLLDAAEQGRLYSFAEVEREVDRMMLSTRLENGVRAFFSDMLGFDAFDTLFKDATQFPNFTQSVARDAREQTLRSIIDYLLVQKNDYRGLFTNSRTYLTPKLAAQLRIPLIHDVPNADGDRWQVYEFPEGDPRAGLLAQPGFTTLHGHPGRTSPTLRGKALRELLLCQEVPPPPPDVTFEALQDTQNPNHKTARERLAIHAVNPTCAGCHRITDPVGLALEAFDSGGGFRRTENGAMIDTSGMFDGVAFDDASGLALALYGNPSVPACLVKRVYAYGAGKPVTSHERSILKTLRTQFAEVGYTLPDLLRTLTTTGSFYETRMKEEG